MCQGKDGLVVGEEEIRKVGFKSGPKEKRAGSLKPNDHNRMKAKQKLNRPTRGLVFGPIGGDGGLSESGKRLRVENVNAGREGGAFSQSSIGDMEIVILSESNNTDVENVLPEAKMQQREREPRLQSDGKGASTGSLGA